MAAQIVWTLYPDVVQVSISVNGVLLDPQQPYTRQALESFSPDRVPGTGQVVSDPYFIDAGGSVVDLLDDNALYGRLGTGSAKVVSAAMSAATGTVAAISQIEGHQTLLIGRVDGGTSQSALQATTLTQPSFNRTGDEVWVVQNGATSPEIYQVSTSAAATASGVPSRAKVAVNGLKGAVTGLTLSPDGVRVALVIDQQLYMGAIASSSTVPKPGSTTPATADAPDTLSVINLEPIRAGLSQVGPVAFSSATQVLAVGRDAGSSLGLRSITEMDVDGFDASQLTATGLNNDVQSLAVSTVAAVSGPSTATPDTATGTTPVAASMYVVWGTSGRPGQVSALNGASSNGEWISVLDKSGASVQGTNVFFPN